MNRAQIEVRVLLLAELVRAKRSVEDSLVELKSEWPSPERFARQLAGLCNAARGQPALLVVGLDEERGVVGAPPKEISEWHAKLKPCFEGIAPRLLDDVSVITEGVVLHALVFETDRAPHTVYVLDQQGGRTERLEVPFRVATGTQSARREDLLRILVPVTTVPILEILGGSIVDRTMKTEAGVVANLEMYCTPQSREVVGLSAHRLELELWSDSARLDGRIAHVILEKTSPPMSGSHVEVFVDAPSRFKAQIAMRGPHLSLQGVPGVRVVVHWTPGGGDRPAVAEAEFIGGNGVQWSFQPRA